MILAFDTYYFENKAKTVCVVFENWNDVVPVDVVDEIIEGVEEYEPGQFYKRELPCIMSLLKKIDLKCVKVIVVDGFVVLDDNGKKGLGGYLYEELDGQIPIIGVAKSNFFSNKKNSIPLLRGESKKPLYVTAQGVELDEAVECIKIMDGSYRMPTLLKIVDSMSREGVAQ